MKRSAGGVVKLARIRVVLVGVAILVACDGGEAATTGSGAESSTEGGSSGGSGESSDATGSTEPSSTTANGATSDAATTDAATTDAATTDAATTDDSGSAGVPGDCRTLLSADASAPSGVHVVHAGGDPEGAEIPVYCDMETDGGGWTLVGRNVAGDWSISIGWHRAHGLVDDDSTPYSLNAGLAELDFTQILIGTYASGKVWGDHVYRLDVPEQFLWIYIDAPVETVATTVHGVCAPEGGPTHLRWTGFTRLDDSFFFGDSLSDLGDGFLPSRLNTDYDDCDRGGLMHNLQGMVFVR
jgi:hypothetical protein